MHAPILNLPNEIFREILSYVPEFTKIYNFISIYRKINFAKLTNYKLVCKQFKNVLTSKYANVYDCFANGDLLALTGYGKELSSIHNVQTYDDRTPENNTYNDVPLALVLAHICIYNGFFRQTKAEEKMKLFLIKFLCKKTPTDIFIKINMDMFAIIFFCLHTHNYILHNYIRNAQLNCFHNGPERTFDMYNDIFLKCDCDDKKFNRFIVTK